MDYNDDNQINYTEFLAATIDHERLKDQDTIKGLFNQFDLDNDGQIDKEELVKVFSKFGKNISIEEIDIIMKTHSNDNELIDFEGF